MAIHFKCHDILDRINSFSMKKWGTEGLEDTGVKA